MKKNNKGFMLVETLIVTAFIVGVLLFLFVQFNSLGNSYSEYHYYNTTEGLYALEDVKEYIKNDGTFLMYIMMNNITDYLDIRDCSHFTNIEYCSSLFNALNIRKIYLFKNESSYDDITIDDNSISNFIKKINNNGEEPYRLVASFNDGTFATLRVRFGV